MRLRNIPGAREEIAADRFVIQEDRQKEMPGKWQEAFRAFRTGDGPSLSSEAPGLPLHIEIGMGKGRFLTELAMKNPGVLYVGIEKYSSVLLRAIQKRERMEAEGTHLTNLLYLRMDAEQIAEVFGPGEVSRIYLNFSDPWPKDRHHKRRLESREFLARYRQVLSSDGWVEFKTDNRGLFDFAVSEAADSGWTIDLCSYDLHADPELMRDNVMTEYEEKFSSQGNPICKMICHP